MANGISNWGYDDVIYFLEKHGFAFGKELAGSHQSWISKDGHFVVEVNRTKSSYPPRTLETMIGNSGLDKEHWKKWTTLNSSLQKKLFCCPKIDIDSGVSVAD